MGLGCRDFGFNRSGGGIFIPGARFPRSARAFRFIVLGSRWIKVLLKRNLRCPLKLIFSNSF